MGDEQVDPRSARLTDAQIRALANHIRARLQARPRHRPWRWRYNYPDQSVASMTPEQAGEVVESFRMEAREDDSGS